MEHPIGLNQSYTHSLPHEKMLDDPPNGSKQILAVPEGDGKHVEVEHKARRNIQDWKPHGGKTVDISLIQSSFLSKTPDVEPQCHANKDIKQPTVVPVD